MAPDTCLTSWCDAFVAYDCDRSKRESNAARLHVLFRGHMYSHQLCTFIGGNRSTASRSQSTGRRTNPSQASTGPSFIAVLQVILLVARFLLKSSYGGWLT